MERALLRVASLIVATAGGRVAATGAAAGPGIASPPAITLRSCRLEQVLGAEIPVREAVRLLEPLGFRALDLTSDAVTVAVPGHRWHDVRTEIDLVEDVARRYGYDNFPTALRPFRPTAVPDDDLLRREDRLRALLIARGLLEARTAAFAPEAEGDVALMRPLSAAEGRLRRALAPGLLHRVEFNFTRGNRQVRLFELGTAFQAGQQPPTETRRLALALSGARVPPHWSGPAPTIDIWDLKGVLAELATELGLQLAPGAADANWIEPGEGFVLTDGDGRLAGWGGRVRPAAVDTPPWADPVYAAELVLAQGEPVRPRFSALPSYPASERDVALLVPETLTAAEVMASTTAAAGPLLEQMEVFDLYRGPGIPAGTRSLALRLRLRASDRTLTDAEVDGVVTRVLNRLEESHGIDRRA
jgi:phenylalanyl-tRNA synthetase beta chain